MLPDSEGLHEIANSTDRDRRADIVFVHGLGGTSHSTWRHGKQGEGSHFFWPEELGKDLSDCGIWSVGYPAGFTALGKPGMIIEKRAGNLSQKLTNAGLSSRPLLFITHSMGGLVVKSLIVGSQTLADADRKRLVSMIRGIVFCATPHRGSALADAAGVLGKFFGGTQDHVDEMRANAEPLDILHDQFIEWHRIHSIPVSSYAENIGLFRTRRWWWRPVPLGLVVPRASANPGIAGHTVRDVDDDHLTLVKPSSRKHDVYAGVLRFIRDALAEDPSQRVDVRPAAQASLPASQPAVETITTVGMPMVYLSYSQQDRAWVEPLVDALTAEGWNVWWDLKVRAGEAFDRAIERNLQDVRCVVAVWSEHSVDSDWVRAEAAWAKEQDKLVSIRIEGQFSLPIQFYHVHTQRMAGWEGSREAPAFRKLVEDIRAVARAPKTVTDDTTEHENELVKSRKTVPPGRGREPLSSFREPLRDGGEGPEMVVIPAGHFWMGSPEDEPERQRCEGPRRRVEIARPFALSRTAVTFDQYDRFAEATGRDPPSAYDWSRASRPVIDVSWDDAVAYAKWICEQSGRRYRLPREVEWEYACRAGTETPFSTGDCIHTDQANYDGNYDYNNCGANTGVHLRKTVATGSVSPNPWGLHEMHGNVWEWLQDCWHENYRGAPTNAQAWEDAGGGGCGRRVIRGGSWSALPMYLRSAARLGHGHGTRDNYLGFRLAQDLDH